MIETPQTHKPVMKRAQIKIILAAIATLIDLLAIAPVGAFEVLPDKDDRDAACGHAKESRGWVNAAKRDEILRRYGLPPGIHPDYEIDHLVPLCLGGSDDPSNLWPQPRRSIEMTWNTEAKDRLERLMCDMGLRWTNRHSHRSGSFCD